MKTTRFFWMLMVVLLVHAMASKRHKPFLSLPSQLICFT